MFHRIQFTKTVTQFRTLAGLVLILAITSIFAFQRIKTLPAQIYGFDIEFNINHLQQILSGNYVVYFTSTNREVLYYYLGALVATVTGLPATYFTLRLTSALIALGTVSSFYYLTKRLFGLRAAFFGSLFLGLSSYHTLLQRLGYRAITLPLMLTLVTLFLFKALWQKRPLHFLVLGLLLGAGLYSYTSFILIPPFIFTILIVYLALKKDSPINQSLRLISLALFTFLLTSWPLLSFAHNNWDLYWQRVERRQAEFNQQQQNLTQQTRYFKDNYWRSITMFNIKGQVYPLYENTQPGEPYLDAISAKLLLLGLALFALNFKKPKYNYFLMLFLLSPVLGSLMSLGFPKEVPAPARMSMALLPVFTMIGTGADKVILALLRVTPPRLAQHIKVMLYLLTAVLLMFVFQENSRRIFVDFPATLQQIDYP